MSSYNKACSECGSGGFGKLICVLMLVGIAVSMIVYAKSHADKHGSSALAGRLLCDPNMADQVWINEKVNRCAYLTEEDTGKVFVHIIEGEEDEITLYLKDDWRAAINAVKRYGYHPFQ